MSLKPWREVAIPHEDVLKGTFLQSEFAADLSRVHDGNATDEYQLPILFFQRTFITEGMRLLLDSVVRRIAGKGGDPVIQLQTAFGGGKTHTMMAVYHLAKGGALASELQGVPPILDIAGITELPKAKLVVIDGNKLAPNVPRQRGDVIVNTMWGELAWQLGREQAYAMVKDADTSGTSPGKEVLTELLTAYAPCVILVDELVAYIRQFEEGKSYAGGSYDSNLSFVQALTEALKAVPTAVLLASLPESEKEAGSQRGVNALRALEHYFGRVQALWKPVATEEAFEIVRRRLFSSVNDRLAMESVCRSYADFYIENGSDLPPETQESRYYERLTHAYPIHPEVFDRLYKDWSTLDNFQRTRGVLKLMAKVIYRLWKDNNRDSLIMPGNLPLYDRDTLTEAVQYLPQGWDPVVEGDIDGERSETAEIENRDPRFGSVQACRRAARTVFLGSAPISGNQVARGLELERVILGCAQPNQQTSLYKDALRRLNDRLHYLNHGNNRFWFDTRPNLRREMEDRKRRFDDKMDVFPTIRDRLSKMFASALFTPHVFTPGSDVQDDWALRLVVLPPDAAFSKTGHSLAIERANEILKNRGDQPRQKQNRLLFIAADYETVTRLKEEVRSLLAWQSIVNDIKDVKLNLDQYQARQASQSLDAAGERLRRMIREAYRWLLAPMQEVRPASDKRPGLSDVQWEHFQLNASAQNFSQEIERVLHDNELVITEWSPIHLANVLKAWFWKDENKEAVALDVWHSTCKYLYLPRLSNDAVFQRTAASGAASRDFFGVAYGKADEKYQGFSFGKNTIIIWDGTLLLIEPVTSAGYAESVRIADEATKVSKPQTTVDGDDSRPRVEDSGTGTYSGGQPVVPVSKTQFYGSIQLDSVQAKRQFSELVDEVLLQFTAKPGVRVEIIVDIRADSSAGFDEVTQRVVKENCNVLRFRNAEFDE